MAEETKPLGYGPKPPREPVWLWIIVGLYAVGLACCWFLDRTHVIPAMEGLTCVFSLILAVIFGIKYGTHDKDYWG